MSQRTEVLYMPDIEGNYIRKFEAKIIKAKPEFVILDRTAFYPEGGGQPSDIGTFSWEGGSAKVTVVKKKGDILHYLEGDIPAKDTTIMGELEWEPRHAHMRMHTSQHILSGVVFDDYDKAKTVGNQIHADHSRVDFRSLTLAQEDLPRIEERCNEIIAKNIDVTIYEEDRADLEKRVDSQRAHLYMLPPSVKRLRIVQIGDFDLCPCAGTHVKNTGEIGRLRILKRENKGKETQRLVYSLE